MNSKVLLKVSAFLLTLFLLWLFFYPLVSKLPPISNPDDLENGYVNLLRFEYAHLENVNTDEYLSADSRIIRLDIVVDSIIIQTYHYGTVSEAEELQRQNRISSLLIYRTDDNLWFLEDYTLKSTLYGTLRYWLGFLWLKSIFQYQVAIIISYLIIPLPVFYLFYRILKKIYVELPDNRSITIKEEQDVKTEENNRTISDHNSTKIELDPEPFSPPTLPFNTDLTNTPDLNNISEKIGGWIQDIVDFFTN